MIFFFKQKTAYEIRISDWSSDVCSSDLTAPTAYIDGVYRFVDGSSWKLSFGSSAYTVAMPEDAHLGLLFDGAGGVKFAVNGQRSEEHTSELQSLMRISYAVFCLKKKKTYKRHMTHQR